MKDKENKIRVSSSFENKYHCEKAIVPTTTRRVILMAAIIVYIAMALYAAPNVNGSDQYWHMNNIDSIINSDVTSNEFYARVLLSSNWQGEKMPMIHSTPVMHIWAFIASITGEVFHTSIGFNMLCLIISSLLLYAVFRKYFNDVIALIVFLLVLFTPLCFWQSVQLLMEVPTLLFISIGLYLCFYFKDVFLCQIVAIVFFSLAFVTRTNFGIFYIIVLLICCINSLKILNTSKVKGVVSVVTCLTLSVVSIVIFNALSVQTSGTFSGDDISILETIYLYSSMLVGNADNMFIFHYIPRFLEPYSFGQLMSNIFDKTILTIIKQFSFNTSIVLYVIPNIMLLTSFAYLVYMAVKKRTSDKHYWPCFVCVVATVMSILICGVWLQNQARYLVIYFPFILFAFAVSIRPILDAILSNSGGYRFLRNSFILAFTILIGLVLCDSALTYKSHSDAKDEAATIAVNTSIFDKYISKESTVAMINGGGTEFMVTYPLYPRTVLFISANYDYTTKEYEQMIENKYYPSEYIVLMDSVSADAVDKIGSWLNTPLFENSDYTIYEVSAEL